MIKEIEEAIKEDLDIKNMQFGNVEENLNYSRIEFKNCKFESCKISGSLEKTFFTDCTFF